MSFTIFRRLSGIYILLLSVFSSSLQANGVLPETTAVILYTQQKGGSINVKNTDAVPILLYSKIIDLPDDKEPSVIVTQPVVRLEPGQTQRVRFVITSNTQLTSEHLKRVSFESIPAKTEGEGNSIQLSISQNLPLILVPEETRNGKQELWNELNWKITNDHVSVINTGKQVIRLSPELTLLPSGRKALLNKAYILPGENIQLSSTNVTNSTSVRFSPVTRYGFDVGEKIAPLSRN